MSTSAVASHRWRWLEFVHWSTLAQRSSTSALTDSRQLVVLNERPSTAETPSRCKVKLLEAHYDAQEGARVVGLEAYLLALKLIVASRDEDDSRRRQVKDVGREVLRNVAGFFSSPMTTFTVPDGRDSTL